MPCKRKVLSPEDIARDMMAILEITTKDRNDLVKQSGEEKGKIGVTIQTDDPKKPGILQIDINTPAPEHSESKDVILAHLEIDKTTGAIRFCPQGCAPPGEAHEFDMHAEILERMIDIIWEN